MKKLLSICLLILWVATAFAQSKENEAVKRVIKNMFDSMREGDTISYKEAFADKVVIQYADAKTDSTWQLVTINPVEFMQQMAAIKKDAWDEKITRYDDLNMNNGVAVAWAPFQYFEGKRMSYCGISVFQLIKTTWGWKIVSIFYNKKTGKCPD